LFYIVLESVLIKNIPFDHSSPRTIFIMGGGEGSTAREILRHKTAEKVTMCDIDEVKPPYMYYCFYMLALLFA
jgi:spermidine synthase